MKPKTNDKNLYFSLTTNTFISKVGKTKSYVLYNSTVYLVMSSADREQREKSSRYRASDEITVHRDTSSLAVPVSP